MKTYTINDIQAEMSAAGSHWWDKGSMRFFGTRASEKVYQGTGGIYFVTSEKPPRGSRQYSVRQYRPDTKDVDTIGEFCAMSRAQAHRLAAELAGPQAIVADEAHKPIGEFEQFRLDLERNGCQSDPTIVAALIRCAKSHAQIMVDHCNGLDVYNEEGEPLPPLAACRRAIVEYAKALGCKGVSFSGDPRGCTVKLIFENGETNDWGREGWCVPGA